MFNKILTNLAFDQSYLPSLKNFQAKETRQRTIRGMALFFVVLAMLVQVFAFVDAPKSQAAASANDLIPGGVTSKSKLVSDCKDDYHNIKVIYGWYGVSCSDMERSTSTVVSLRSTSYADTLYSVGHLPYGLPGETPVDVAGSTLYWRLLHGWDTGKYSTYTALKVKAVNGRTYFILFTCGNLVSIGFPSQYIPPTPKPPTPTPALCQYNSLLSASSPLCKPCTASTSFNDVLDCLSYSKTASNVTEGIMDANNTTAKAGDIIQYTLKVTNSGQATAEDFVIQENLSDVLDYANPTNLSGGSLNSSNILSWAPVNIGPSQTAQEQFTVQVKDPVPSTAPAADDPEGYNFVMTNVYGNTININVQKPIVATAATVVTTSAPLPNTGPGSGVIIFGLVAIVVGYFYSRSRLLLKESRIVQTMELQKAGTRE